MENLPDIIQSIINQIDLNISINSVEVIDSTTDKLYVCSTTSFLTKTKVVTIDGLDYTVTDFDLNNWIEVTPKGHATVVPTDTKVITTGPITFLHGAPYSVNAEYLSLDTDTLNKTPFIWLLESYEFDDLPRDSSIDLAFNARLFFLDWYSERNRDSNDDQNNYAIKPMQNLQRSFVKVINDDFNFKTLGTVSTTVRPRFGVSVGGRNGAPQPKEKIIDDDLSGVDSRMKIEVYDASSCSCD
jgi:hypothetical protein